jgi:hypothetical protein
LGAGALTLGLGAAVAGSTGVAQADTGGEHATGSASVGKHPAGSSADSKATSPAANGSGISAAASIKRVLVPPPATATPLTPASAPPLRTAMPNPTTSVSPAAGAASTPKAAASAAQTTSGTQTISTPIGPITLTLSTTAPAVGISGAVTIALDATTPLGKAEFSLTGWQSYGTDYTLTAPTPFLNEINFNKGTAVVPSPITFLLDSFSPMIAAAASLVNSASSFFDAVNNGNTAGAAAAFFFAPLNFTTALFFGHQTVTLPLSIQNTFDSTQPDLEVDLNIPFGGIFSSLQTPSLTIPLYSFWDAHDQLTFQVFTGTVDNQTQIPASVPLTGTQFGGIVPEFLSAIGL